MSFASTRSKAVPLWQASILGGITGLRSTSGLAALSWGGPFPRLASGPGRTLTTAALAGELVVDKLPFTPSRLAPAPLLGRAVLGAVCGGLLYRRASAPVWRGALVGGVAAVAAAFAGNKLRASIGRRTGARDVWVALGEDALMAALGTTFLLG